jgi:hypothetical protein
MPPVTFFTVLKPLDSKNCSAHHMGLTVTQQQGMSVGACCELLLHAWLHVVMPQMLQCSSYGTALHVAGWHS